MTSLIYRNASIYELAMLALYRGNRHDRHLEVAARIDAGATVVDLCCGPATLRRFLPAGTRYTGLDMNRSFVNHLQRQGVDARLVDLARHPDDIPPGDHVVMEASLYHFIPDAAEIVARMVAASRRSAIVVEPIRNMSTSGHRVLASVAQRLTDPGSGTPHDRFDERLLDEVIARFESSVLSSSLTAAGREKLYVLRGAHP